MNRSVRVRDVMTRSYVGVSESDPVTGAATLMRDDGVTSAVVLRGQKPVGMLHAGDLIDLIADGRDPESTTVTAAMTDSVISIDADSDVTTAVNAIADTDARQLVVLENGEITGVLSEHDMITAHAIRQTDPTDHAPETEPLNSAQSPTDEFTTQSVCEACGSLAESLTERNGQLVCPDCVQIEM